MPSTPNAIRKWLDIATPDQARALAKAADTSVPHLRHIAAGRRNVEPPLGQRIAKASRTLGKRALYLDQRDLCRICAICPLAKR